MISFTVHEGIKKFQCDKCEKSYKDFCDLNIHMYNVHENQKDNNGNEEAIAESSSSVKKMLACGHCPKEFPTPSKLKRHVTQIHLGIKNYQW